MFININIQSKSRGMDRISR